MKRCFIFAAGSFYGLRERPGEGDFVIAADAGIYHCRAAGIEPDLLLGDFDSMKGPACAENICRLPVEKDDTDTLAAVKVALEKGCRDIYIYGGTGGKRLDHTLANLQTLLYIRRRGAYGWLYDDDFIWTVIENESICISKTVEWGLCSVFCLSGLAVGVDEIGVQYAVHNGTLSAEYPLGVSNHIIEPEAQISVRDGALAVGWELSPGE